MILLHRIGVILTFVSSILLVILPHILNRPDDLGFVLQLRQILIWIIRVGLALLVLSGIFRLSLPLPALLVVKLVVVLVTLLWSWFKLHPTPDPTADLLFVVFFNLSAVFGILLG